MTLLDQELTYGYCPIDLAKSYDTPDGMMVFGKVAGPGVDMDHQRFDETYLKTAVPEWFKWANIREQHSQIASGVGHELTQEGDEYFIKALIVDDGTIKKIKNKVLKGFSPGVKRGKVIRDPKGKAPKGLIVGGDMVEISLVDRPSDPTNLVSICKSAGGTTLFPKERKVEWLTEDLYKSASATALDVLEGELEDADADLVKATVVQMADLGIAELMMLKSAAADDNLTHYDIGGLINATNALMSFVDPDAEGYPGMADDFRELTKSATVDDTTDVVKAAVADLTKAYDAKIEALSAEVERLRAMPAVGGPVVMPLVDNSAQTLQKSAQAEAKSYLDKASTPGLDPVLAAMYRRKAEATQKGATS